MKLSRLNKRWIPLPFMEITLVFMLGFWGLPIYSGQLNNPVEEDQIHILLPEISVVEKKEYLLGEIARIEGMNSFLIDNLRKMKIGRSPLPGKELRLTGSIILSRIRSNKIDTKKIIFPGSHKTLIQRAALKIPGTDIDRTVMEYIHDSFPEQDIRPRILANSRDLYLPRGKISFRVVKKGRHLREGGYQTFEVEFSVDGEIFQKVPVRTYVKVYKDVLIAKGTIKRNQVISETDVTKTRKNVDRVSSSYVTDTTDIVGKMASRTINPNEVIRENSLTEPPTIKAGDRLLIVYESQNLKLTAPGISLQEGIAGERIQVNNLESRNMVFAIIKDSKHVLVN